MPVTKNKTFVSNACMLTLQIRYCKSVMLSYTNSHC